MTAVAQRLASRRRQVLCCTRLHKPTHFYLHSRYHISDNILLVLQVDETLSPFRLSQEQLKLVKARMRAGLEAGLKSKGPSAIKMLPSFVYRTPDGTGQKLT